MKYAKKDDFDKINLFGTGIPREMFAQYFIGDSFLNFLTKPGEAPIFLANVTFEPRCLNYWHIHHAKSSCGQLVFAHRLRSPRRRQQQRAVGRSHRRRL